MMANQHQRGMTLIELLVAMAIFAVMTSSMFIAFNSFQKAKEVTDVNAERLKQYQIAFNIISRDIQQMAPRAIRDEFGSETRLYALRAESDNAIEFSRYGWNRSPFSKTKRSEIQRVSYYLEEKKLMRASWRVLDRAEDTTPSRTELLDEVESLSFLFFYQDKQNKWKEEASWPPYSMMSGGSGDPTHIPEREFILLPKVLDIKLTTSDMGEFNRKFLIANCFVDVLHPTTGGDPLGGGCGS